MALITPTQMPKAVGPGFGPGVYDSVTLTTLGASDYFDYLRGTGQLLILRNPTGGTLSPVIDGANGSSVIIPGRGRVGVNAGYAAFAITSLQTKLIWLDTIPGYLQGSVFITSGAGLLAGLINPV